VLYQINTRLSIPVHNTTLARGDVCFIEFLRLLFVFEVARGECFSQSRMFAPHLLTLQNSCLFASYPRFVTQFLHYERIKIMCYFCLTSLARVTIGKQFLKLVFQESPKNDEKHPRKKRVKKKTKKRRPRARRRIAKKSVK
jgi:hypothetical protein